jgi:phage shock protein A
VRKAEVAVDKNENDLAPAAIERKQASYRMTRSFQEHKGVRRARLERDTEVEQLLAEIKNHRQLTAGS